jgi:hypothetical protein
MARPTIASLTNTITELRADIARITEQQLAIIKAQAATITALEAEVGAAKQLDERLDVLQQFEDRLAARLAESDLAAPTQDRPVGAPYRRSDGHMYRKFVVGFNRTAERRVD